MTKAMRVRRNPKGTMQMIETACCASQERIPADQELAVTVPNDVYVFARERDRVQERDVKPKLKNLRIRTKICKVSLYVYVERRAGEGYKAQTKSHENAKFLFWAHQTKREGLFT